MRLSLQPGDISFYVATAFLLGVLAANEGWNGLIIAGLELVTIAGVLVFFRSKSVSKAVFFLCASMMAGFFYYHTYAYWQRTHTKLPEGKQTAFFAVITAEPNAAGNFVMVKGGLIRPYAGTVDIFISPKSAQFHYGDEVWIEGTMTSSSDTSEPPALFLPRVRLIAEHQGVWLEEMIIDFKQAFIQKIAQLFSPDEAALFSGILIGTTGTVSAALKAQMETSGTTYMVNMYGYKMAIITAALAASLKDHISRRALLWISLAALALFVFISGGAISAVRAAVMGAFAIVARGIGRTFSTRNAVTFAALGMVLMNATLLTDAGFQLSFLSFLGIYYLGQSIYYFFRWTDGGVLDWKSHTMLSLATNLAILPVAMNTFGVFSLTSLISNILIMIPWVGVIGFGALAVVLGFISPPLAFLVSQITGILLQYELFIIHIFSVIVIPMPAIFGSAIAIILYYCALVLFTYYYAPPSQKNN